jgi:hypothetical protein
VFDSLDEIESTEGGHSTALARVLRFAGITLLSAVVFWGTVYCSCDPRMTMLCEVAEV